MLCCLAGSFMKCSKDHCAVGQVLVICNDGQLSKPTEQALKKLFYAGPAAGDPADVTWHLSVKYDQNLCRCCMLAVHFVYDGLLTWYDLSYVSTQLICCFMSLCTVLVVSCARIQCNINIRTCMQHWLVSTWPETGKGLLTCSYSPGLQRG